MDKIQVFTSTGFKLIHRPDLVERLKKGEAFPISLQIAPTSRCQLSCVFCSNVKRNKQEDLDYQKLRTFLWKMRDIEVGSVEWTGGGDPTLYEFINRGIAFAASVGYEQGFITNGIGLDKLTIESLEKLKWLRISMNCLDYVSSIEITNLPKNLTLGFSYVMNKKTTSDVLFRLKNHTRKFNPEYVRIVPDCQTSRAQQILNNREFSKMVEDWGDPYFYQAKLFRKPELCYWGHIKPFLLHDGYVYRCSSVVLNDEAERSFHQKYRWCEMTDFPQQFEKSITPFVPDSCSHCVFSEQNDLIHEIIYPNKMWRFV